MFPFGDSRTLLYILFHTERKQFLIIKLYTVFLREAKDSKANATTNLNFTTGPKNVALTVYSYAVIKHSEEEEIGKANRTTKLKSLDDSL